jgi:hypothetical protein
LKAERNTIASALTNALALAGATRHELIYRNHSMKKQPVTYDTVRRVGLTLPNVKESTSYRTPALKVGGKLFVRLHQDFDKIVVKMPFDRREELMAVDPETYFITDHYRDYPWILVSLSNVREDALTDLLKIAHREASPAKKRRV